MVAQKKVSALIDGEFITYSLPNTSVLKIEFTKSEDSLEACIYTVLGEPTHDSFNLNLSPEAMDRMQLEIESKGGTVFNSLIL